MKNKRY